MIDQVVCANQPILVERGENDKVLIIAFTGFGDKLHMGVFEFFEATQATKYSRILLRDQYGVWYHHGISAEVRDFSQLIAHLKSAIDELRPEKVLCIGTSAGGYAALVVGHELRADYVHAFGPDTKIEVTVAAAVRSTLRDRNRYRRWKLLFSRRARREIFDLKNLLKQDNGKTVYYVHYCKSSVHDADRAMRINGLPGVRLLAYPCATHAVSVFLAKKGFLAKLLQITNQNHISELAKTSFGEICSGLLPMLLLS